MRKFLLIFLCSGCCLFRAAIANGQSAETMFQQADQLYNESNYAEAQLSYLEALKNAEKNNDVDIIVKSQLAIGRCLYYLRDKKAALEWLYTAMAAAKQHKLNNLLSGIYYSISLIYIETGVVDSAEWYSAQAVELYSGSKQYDKLSVALSALSDVYLNTTRDIAKAERTIREAERYAVLSGDSNSLAFVNMKWYFLNTILKRDYRSALPYIDKAEMYYSGSNNIEGLMYAYNFKAECLAMLGDTLAAHYMHKWFAFKDSVFQVNKAAGIARYEMLYESEKRIMENELLQEENEKNRLVLVVVIIAFLFFAVIVLWMFNRNHLRKKQHELTLLQNLQRDKERIARDLHDNVGGQLSYIIYSLDGINEEDAEKRREVTGSISQSVKSVISSLRDTIWAISDANISVQDFSDKLKVFARELFKHSNTHIVFAEHINAHRELNALLGLNLYRICQEILNNAFKYAAAAEVTIEIFCSEDILRLSIADNGAGFDDSQQHKEQYGLQIMKKRAEEFGISMRRESVIDKGTTYVLLV